jgi:imidazole glycerol-phosphate synthase subunit HisH
VSARTRVTIFDYGAGNMHSLSKALDVGGEVEIRLQTDPIAALDTDALVLPGVGAFANAASRMAPGAAAMRDAILAGLPTLCICLGMQLLFDDSEEGHGAGLGVIPGHVRKLRARRVPQIGWNEVEALDDALPEVAYFANSYVCDPDDDSCVVAYTTHERDRFASVVAVANTVGVQFHPEKSSDAGVRFVRAFVDGVTR